MSYIKKNIGAFVLASILLVLSGCVTQRDIEYMQAKDINIKAYKEADLPEYKLKPYDELYITISSQDEINTNVFSNTGNQQGLMYSSISPYGASLSSYPINKEGYILLPVIGSLYVKNKTLPQVSNVIKDSLTNILNQPIVVVKLINRYVSVLGQVRNAGHFQYSQEKLSVYDALGLAGDMTIYADRKEVVLTRNEDGKNIIIRLDLTKPEILEANYFYLRPNDMVYVKPMKKRIWGIDQFPYSLILSSITTGLLLYNVLK